MTHNRDRRISVAWCISLLGLFLVTACSDSGLNPPLDESAPIYWELRTNYQAVQLSRVAPFDTVQLVAVPYGANGQPLPAGFVNKEGLSVAWISKDSSKVRVSPSGFVTARGEISLSSLEVRVTIGRVTKTNTVDVRVTADPNPPVLDVFAIQLRDSLKRAAGNFAPYSFPILTLDTDGRPMTGFPVRWQSSDPKVARFTEVDLGKLEVLLPERSVMLSVSTLVYGVEKRDSFMLETGWQVALPLNATQARQRRMSNGEIQFVPVEGIIDIGPGGYVAFQNNTGLGPSNAPGLPALPGVPVDIVFDDPSVARLIGGLPGGDILGIPSDTTLSAARRQQLRWFVTPGKHFFTVQPFGFRGSVTVHEK